MENKEIEELLNELKDNNDWYVIENKEEHNTEPYKLLLPTERNLLLSHIEQLENKNKELYEGFMATQEELTYYATKNEQLEKKIDHYENPEDLTLFYMWLDTKAKDKMKQMENEIINLKQQNQIITELGEQLENNRDKAIEILGNYKHYSTPTEEQNRENEDIVDNTYNILKGDSDD